MDVEGRMTPNQMHRNHEISVDIITPYGGSTTNPTLRCGSEDANKEAQSIF